MMVSFNSDMDEYLSRKRRNNDLKKTKKTPLKMEKSNDTEDYREDLGDDTMEAESSHGKKKGVFSMIKEWLSFDDNEEEPSAESEEEMPSPQFEDMKEALKIQNKWLNRLPSDAKKEFKASDDFKRYKSILEKHNLIKKG
jgi:hypothetical protein